MLGLEYSMYLVGTSNWFKKNRESNYSVQEFNLLEATPTN